MYSLLEVLMPMLSIWKEVDLEPVVAKGDELSSAMNWPCSGN